MDPRFSSALSAVRTRAGRSPRKTLGAAAATLATVASFAGLATANAAPAAAAVSEPATSSSTASLASASSTASLVSASAAFDINASGAAPASPLSQADAAAPASPLAQAPAPSTQLPTTVSPATVPPATGAPATVPPATGAPTTGAPAGGPSAGQAPATPDAATPSAQAAARPTPAAQPGSAAPAAAQQPATPSQPYLIYDSVTPSKIPAGVKIATYSTGPFRVAPSAVAGRDVLWIDTNGTNPSANALDVEPGDATPREAAAWAAAKLSSGNSDLARIYTMRSEWPAVKAAVAGLPGWMQDKVRYWIADPTGVPHLVPGSDATQWYWGKKYDVSTALPRF